MRFEISIATSPDAIPSLFEALSGRVDALSLTDNRLSMSVTASDEYAANSHVKMLLAQAGLPSQVLHTRALR